MTQHPNSIDVHVGGRVKFRRKRLGLSLRAVAEELGLSFQQMQKHEKGTDRIRASRLYALADILGVPLTFFFEGLEKDQPLIFGPWKPPGARKTSPTRKSGKPFALLPRP